MSDETCMAMLTAAFAAAMLLLGLFFIHQRKQDEAALLLKSLALSQARAEVSYSRSDGRATIAPRTAMEKLEY